MTHELKTWPDYYKVIESGEKTFEVRKMDRPFEIGHILLLKEWIWDGPNSYEITSKDDGVYTGRQIKMEITYILKGGKFGVSEGYCVMGIKPLIAPETTKN